MAFFQEKRDLFLRIQRQARETSTAKARGTAVTEGSERKKSDSLKKSQPYGRRRSKDAGEIDTSHSTDTESEAEAECSIELIDVPRYAIGKSSLNTDRANGDRQETSTASTGVEQRSGSPSHIRHDYEGDLIKSGKGSYSNIQPSGILSDSRVVQSTNDQPRGENMSGVHGMSDSRAVQSTIVQVRRDSTCTSCVHGMSDSSAVQSTNAKVRNENIDRRHDMTE